jgi:hypothetical protein
MRLTTEARVEDDENRVGRKSDIDKFSIGYENKKKIKSGAEKTNGKNKPRSKH